MTAGHRQATTTYILISKMIWAMLIAMLIGLVATFG